MKFFSLENNRLYGNYLNCVLSCKSFAHIQRLKLESRISGEERHEEVPPSLELGQGTKLFHLTISAEGNHFVLSIAKEKHYYSYMYRSDVKKINKIKYEGSKASLSVGKVRECLYNIYIYSNASYPDVGDTGTPVDWAGAHKVLIRGQDWSL